MQAYEVIGTEVQIQLSVLTEAWYGSGKYSLRTT
jgi:hypothetical protein